MCSRVDRKSQQYRGNIMKNGVICLVILSLILGGRTLMLQSGHREADAVETILHSRIEIMNSFMYGEKNLYSLRNALCKIEKDPILQSDMDVLEVIVDNPTDFEMALSVTIEDVTGIKYDGDAVCMEAVLSWVMLGSDGRYKVTGRYDVGCLNVQGKMYLTSLKYIGE